MKYFLIVMLGLLTFSCNSVPPPKVRYKSFIVPHFESENSWDKVIQWLATYPVMKIELQTDRYVSTFNPTKWYQWGCTATRVRGKKGTKIWVRCYGPYGELNIKHTLKLRQYAELVTVP